MGIILLWFYTGLFYLALPWVLLRLRYRARRNAAYVERWAERFARYTTPAIPHGLWVHAVSLGEVVAMTPLLQRFMAEYPHEQIVVTTMTPTGSAQVQKVFGNRVTHVYAPYDLPAMVHRFLQQMRPRTLVIMEVELWPNILHACAKRDIPVLILNARLSARSAWRYRWLAPLMRLMMQDVTAVAVQTQQEAERYLALGLDQEKLTVVGNMKFDLTLSQDLIDCAGPLREQWGVERFVWVAASTHYPREDEAVLQAFQALREVEPRSILVLVPRHVDRAAEILALCHTTQPDWHVVQRSTGEACSGTTDILLADTMGEMMLFYAAADAAFVGGSIVPLGCHNVLEPAALGLPVITGPDVTNFLAITTWLSEAGGLIKIIDAAELAEVIRGLATDPERRQRMGDAARAIVAKNRGALDRQYALLLRYYRGLPHAGFSPATATT